MGQELNCKLRLGKKTGLGKVLLESQELIVRADALRLKIPFREMRSVEAADGWLRVDFAGSAAAFELGPQAVKWADKIKNPKSLLDKLGVKPGSRVSLAGVFEEKFLADLRARTDSVVTDTLAPDSDLIFLSADSDRDLGRLPALRKSIQPAGAVWVVYPKGQKHITESGVFAAGKKAGLVDVKVASYSSTHTALKFVIPVDRR